MWHAGGYKRILRSAIACSLLVILGAYAEEPEIRPELVIPPEAEILDLTEIPTDSETPPEDQQKLFMLTGNSLSGQFEKLHGQRVTLEKTAPGCPVLVSPIPEGEWIVDDFGVDFVMLSKADGSGAITYPTGRLCLWTATDE